MTGSYKTGGLVKDKYLIYKLNPIRSEAFINVNFREEPYADHIPVSLVDKEAQYFVLRVDADPHARVALYEYAVSVRLDNPKLCEEIIAWLEEIEGQR